VARRRRGWLALATVLVVRAASADPPQPAPELPRPSYRLDFSAGQVEIEGEGDQIELSRDVVVRVDRYRLTSDRLRLSRGPRGIVVDGEGRVAFCPCADPPVSIGFASATAAPPTDLLLEKPTLRVGSVPVLWLPYFWLRSPDRAGLLPPKVAWRGGDGLLAGAGAHVPFGPSAPDRRRSSIDLEAAGYFKGGVDLQGRLETATSSNTVRWDHLNQSLLAVDARGAVASEDGAVGAWQIDAIRGARGLSGTILLEPAARRYDRLDGSVALVENGALLGAGVSGTDRRGAPMDDPGTLGPEFYLGAGSALDDVGRVEASVAATTATDADAGTLTLIEQRGELGFDARPGPFTTELTAGERLVAAVTEAGSGGAFRGGGELELGFPLERAYGEKADPLIHRIEPFLEGTGLFARTRELPLPAVEPVGDADLIAAVGGLRTRLGAWGRRSAATLEATGGYAGDPQALVPVLAARASGDAETWALRSEAAWLPNSERSLAVVGHGRIGRTDGLKLEGYAEGRLELEPQLARWLESGAWRNARYGWFDRPGWTLGGLMGVPWTDFLATAAGLDYDATARELLGVRGTLAYRHRCGCLAVLTWVGHRVGRDGVDAWAAVDLLP